MNLLSLCPKKNTELKQKEDLLVLRLMIHLLIFKKISHGFIKLILMHNKLKKNIWIEIDSYWRKDAFKEY